MRAVKNNLPTPSERIGKSEGPRWTRVMGDQSSLLSRKKMEELGALDARNGNHTSRLAECLICYVLN